MRNISLKHIEKLNVLKANNLVIPASIITLF